MFRYLCNTLIPNRIINGGVSKPLFLCSHFTSQNPCLLLLHLHNRIRSISFSSSPLVVSYLMNSCGLTEKQALSTSKKLNNLKTLSNPDYVLTVFESYGFTKPDISKIIIKNPELLLYDVHKTLKPKLDYFYSKEISRLELIKVLSANPIILIRSLENHIIPFFDCFKNIVGTDRYVFTVIGRTHFHPAELIEKVMLNIQVLRDEGVRISVNLLINRPSTLMINTVKFKDIVQEIKGMGFDPYKTTFLSAVRVFTAMTKSTWDAKLNAYRKWGWSEDEILNAFKVYPTCMSYSTKKISLTMDYFVNQMGYNASLMARYPILLGFSLKKRIIPRCSAYQILVSKGLIKDQVPICLLFLMNEESFLEKFVIKYEKETPELLKVYYSLRFNTS